MKRVRTVFAIAGLLLYSASDYGQVESIAIESQIGLSYNPISLNSSDQNNLASGFVNVTRQYEEGYRSNAYGLKYRRHSLRNPSYFFSISYEQRRTIMELEYIETPDDPRVVFGIDSDEYDKLRLASTDNYLAISTGVTLVAREFKTSSLSFDIGTMVTRWYSSHNRTTKIDASGKRDRGSRVRLNRDYRLFNLEPLVSALYSRSLNSSVSLGLFFGASYQLYNKHRPNSFYRRQWQNYFVGLSIDYSLR